MKHPFCISFQNKYFDEQAWILEQAFQHSIERVLQGKYLERLLLRNDLKKRDDHLRNDDKILHYLALIQLGIYPPSFSYRGEPLPYFWGFG